MFYLFVRIEVLKKSGLSQCFLCQRFGHGSQNCRERLRCVKCSEEHTAKACPKLHDQPYMYCNCGGDYTTHFQECPYYKHALEISKPVIPQNIQRNFHLPHKTSKLQLTNLKPPPTHLSQETWIRPKHPLRTISLAPLKSWIFWKTSSGCCRHSTAPKKQRSWLYTPLLMPSPATNHNEPPATQNTIL